ncbi:MAG: LysM peptidoglycan-binding domain-containing protein [Bacteroidia bacterium]|nr:LysM peptidoglycan-binding domain-containing protein [Bacteroidia bacterium]
MMKNLRILTPLFALFFALIGMNPCPGQILDRGLAEVIEESSNTGKNLALHRSIPVGTYLVVKNAANGRTTTVRVVGKLPDIGANEKVVIKISKSAYQSLLASGRRFAVEIYPKPKVQSINHEVIEGETLYSISKKYEVSVDDIKKWNELQDDIINRGRN